MTREELKHQIKFYLSELGSQNLHHEFEHLSRNLTTSRICKNILPATGPVSAGGDQGADFETFRVNTKDFFGSSSYVGFVNDKRAVFACTIQKDRIKEKVKEDLEKTVSRPVKPEMVYYFSTQKVEVSIRHELQDWAIKEKGIELEIFDLEAISELLSYDDTYWIAVQHLKMPAELAPPPPEKSKYEWHDHLIQKYKTDNKSLVYNFAEFQEIKRAVRLCTFNESYKPFLAFWISCLKLYIEYCTIERLTYLARYEIAVASIRGEVTLKI